MMNSVRKGLAAGAVALVAITAPPGSSAHAGTLGLDFNPADIRNTGFNWDTWTLGYQFRDNIAASVTALGTWDKGILGNTSVGLWDGSGRLLASTTVTATGTPVGSAPWLFASITPVPLTPGANYYVGSYGDANYAYFVGQITTSPEITYLQDAYAYGGLRFPTYSDGAPYSFFGGNVELGTASAMPEPTSVTLLTIGFAGLALARRRRRI
jgi:hypothetical protein